MLYNTTTKFFFKYIFHFFRLQIRALDSQTIRLCHTWNGPTKAGRLKYPT